jgi:hypothetical protein
MVGRVGFEPTTNGLKGRCSTTELPTQQTINKALTQEGLASLALRTGFCNSKWVYATPTQKPT